MHRGRIISSVDISETALQNVQYRGWVTSSTVTIIFQNNVTKRFRAPWMGYKFYCYDYFRNNVTKRFKALWMCYMFRCYDHFPKQGYKTFQSTVDGTSSIVTIIFRNVLQNVSEHSVWVTSSSVRLFPGTALQNVSEHGGWVPSSISHDRVCNPIPENNFVTVFPYEIIGLTNL